MKSLRMQLHLPHNVVQETIMPRIEGSKILTLMLNSVHNRLDEENGEYVDLDFKYNNTRGMWEVLKSVLLKDNEIGEVVRNNSIIMCEGSKGWDDYILLHTFID